jgi:KDO2-lipid IV(A) lauroyltransferase
MAKSRAKTPRILRPAVYYGVRTAIAAASVPRLGLAREAARTLGRWYARSPINRRHMRRARGNISAAFPDWTPDQVDQVAVQSHEHLVTFGVELACTPRVLTEDAWMRHISPGTIGPALRTLVDAGPAVLITGHCGNWEVLGYTIALLGFPMHAVYRPLDLPSLDRWVRGTRSRRGL